MMIHHQREKLINAIIYFVQQTQNCGKIKLFKLLYFLDFHHFSETGRSVTGLEYYAWKLGPCPTALDQEIEPPTNELQRFFRFENVKTSKSPMLNLIPLQEFDPSHFTKREARIMQNLATTYCTATSNEMIEATHVENQPWHQIYEVEKRPNALIPYEYALKRQELEEMKAHIQETREFWQHYQ